MRILIVTSDYPAFVTEFYAGEPTLRDASYAEQMRRRNESLFANADFYSRAMTGHGAMAADIYMNNAVMQRGWARENGVRLPRSPLRKSVKRVLSSVPGIGRFVAPPGAERPAWVIPILAAQIESFRPDVLLNADVHNLDAATLRRIRGNARLVVAQTNSALDPSVDYAAYDCVLTAFPGYVRHFSADGVTARLSRLAFEPSVLERLRPGPRRIPLSFVGGFDAYHQERRDLLEFLCARTEVAVWGPNADSLSAGSAIKRRLRGTAWGRDMLQIFADSEIVLNHELPISRPFAANMRYYEATGCGALLLTDRRDASGMFEPGRELVFYDDPANCLRLIQELRSDPARCREIAEAGQRRTLREHTYAARAGEMLRIFEELMDAPAKRHAAAGGP